MNFSSMTRWCMTFAASATLLFSFMAFGVEAQPEVSVRAPDASLCLWYTKPAVAWEEALPIGNGILGAMIYGGVAAERIQFNEHTVWKGQPHAYQHEGAASFLPEIRRLLFAGGGAGGEVKSYDAPEPTQILNVDRLIKPV